MIKRWWFFLYVFLCTAQLVHAAIVIDAITTSGGTGDFGNDTFSHTVSADANFLLVCTSTTFSTTTEDITSITYNTVSLSLLVAQQQGSGNRVELWYLLAPASGTNNVVVNATDDPFYVYTAISLKGVSQSTPIHVVSATGTNTTSAITVTSAVGEFVIDCVTVANDITGTVGSGQTERVDTTHDSQITQLMSTMNGSASSIEPDWTFSENVGFAHAAVSLAPLAAVTGGRRMMIAP